MFGGQKTYDYHQCRDCGAVYQYPIPEPDVIASFYPDIYRIYIDKARIKKRNQLEKAILKNKYGYTHLQVPAFFPILALIFSPFLYRDNVHFRPNGKALDIGCGNGHFMLGLRELGWACEGVEFNLTAVDICRSYGFKVHHGDMESAKLLDNSFDLITASHVIEHLPDPVSFMKEAARILKKDGQLLVKTPNSQALGRGLFKESWFANDVPRHLFLYSPSNLDMLAAQHGLKRSRMLLKTTVKYILNSIDYKSSNVGKPSKNKKVLRLLAKPYVLAATVFRMGDRIHAVYQKV
jgi:2-polyprenyl-3-methyl-5-hydroxy-6-metoxy-1,4-benzoquinol methylase